MPPLTLDDLLPLEEYAARRHEFFAALGRYQDHYRRVRIGPQLTLLFENRQTLWFRVQEILRISRLSEPARVQQELDVYNWLLPGRNQLKAALLLAGESEAWREARGHEFVFELGDHPVPARLVTCRPEDRAIGTAHWVEFTLEKDARNLLANPRIPARFASHWAHYQHNSAPLGEEVRQSLLDDLKLSDRDG
ncbi:MAG TPA: DUF3501 family protein [Gemmataceae bacterium]|nr:DUF3501 family protein [Gemmataceae bacterium]